MTALTAPALILTAAELIERHDHSGYHEDTLGLRLTLTTAACWAVAGRPCQPRDLSPEQAEHVAEVMDHFEAKLGSIDIYEREHATDTSAQWASTLRALAFSYQKDLASVSKHVDSLLPPTTERFMRLEKNAKIFDSRLQRFVSGTLDRRPRQGAHRA